MEYFVCVVVISIVLLVLKIIFGGNLAELKKYKENKELEDWVAKLPNNQMLCEELLQKLDNQTVKIEPWKDEKIETSVYTVYNNTIRIGSIDKSYTRLQTIAHECLHSIQPKRLLMFNFIFSNFYFIYFMIILGITAFGFVEYRMLQAFILLLLGMIHFAVRNYLEQDAMTKARFLAEEYLAEKQMIGKQEQKELLKEYDKLNKLGIPMVTYTLLCNNLVKVILYLFIAIIL